MSRLARACERRLMRHSDEGVQLRRVRVNALQIKLRQLDARELARRKAGGKFRQSLFVETHSITFGTRYSPASTCGAFC